LQTYRIFALSIKTSGERPQTQQLIYMEKIATKTEDLLIAVNVTELRLLQSEHGGEIVLAKRRDGHNFWDNLGYKTSLLNMPANDSDTVIRYRKGDDIDELAYACVVGDYESYSEAIADIHPDADLRKCIDVLEKWANRINEIIEEVEEGVDCDIWMNNPDGDKVNYVVNGESTSFLDDVYNYHLALQLPNEA
jgi:hypothetical protein